MEKEKILNAWIMTEHLSEGDINTSDKNLLRFDELESTASEERDYYQFLKDKIQFYSKRKNLGKNSGLVIYFDIFKFESIIDFLRQQFKLEKTGEDIHYGDKFSFALYFDRNLQYDKDKFFYTESAYMRRFKTIPFEEDFKEFEKDEQEKLAQRFDEVAEDAEKFNLAMQETLRDHGAELKHCRFQLIQNIETDATNLHSFFIDDLEKAKKIETPNLTAYLTGGRIEDRVNLNSKKGSPDFNAKALIEILSPEHYPLGRFPSNTEYALSLMQQIAVNLTSAEAQNISSVNGPPGTGKTTLLKDIFADLIVKQALSITNLKEHHIKGTSETVYFHKASIGELPDEITANSIVVTSSNNGAVQNIVNELPLRKEIDEQFQPKLDELDYFTDIANTQEEEKGDTGEDEQKFWGLFSLEGGKSSNVKKILKSLESVAAYLKEEYESDETVYQRFLEAYQELKTYRDRIADYAHQKQEKDKLDVDLEENKNELAALQEHQENDLQSLNELEPGIAIIKKRHPQKHGIFGILKKLTNDDTETYSSEEKNFHDRYMELKDAVERRSLKMMTFREKRQQLLAKQQALCNKLLDSEKQEIIDLDLNQPYEDLQLSNPWFNKKFRIKQSELFLLALAVRKQFLFENQKNVKAAYNIWKNQKDHVENPRLLNAAWSWINMTIPVISSTFASFERMMKHIGPEVLGYVFVDEAGQALPQSAVGAIWRSRKMMVVGDPSQIKPVLTLDSNILKLLCRHYQISERYLSEDASVQTLVDAASRFGFYTAPDKEEDSWIGIPLWVHRRCQYPMFTIANKISYHDFMVQGVKQYGKTAWFDVKGKAVDKYVKEQGEFLKQKLKEMIAEDPEIIDPTKKDKVYIISPFRNVAYKLAQLLKSINFTRTQGQKATNIGTVHTFQGKEAAIVFLVLGADEQSKSAANWAVDEPNIMNVAATRAKKEFYIIGDKKMYGDLGSDVIRTTLHIMKDYKKEHPDLVMDQSVPADRPTKLETKPEVKPKTQKVTIPAPPTKASEKICPVCGHKMVRRMARRGPNSGKEFWGCSNFPKCRHTEKFD